MRIDGLKQRISKKEDSMCAINSPQLCWTCTQIWHPNEWTTARSQIQKTVNNLGHLVKVLLAKRRAIYCHVPNYCVIFNHKNNQKYWASCQFAISTTPFFSDFSETLRLTHQALNMLNPLRWILSFINNTTVLLSDSYGFSFTDGIQCKRQS